MVEMRNAYKILNGKSERRRSLGRLRGRGKNNIKMISGKSAGQLWIGFIWLRIGTINGGEFLD
jgi:hypothetical protein